MSVSVTVLSPQTVSSGLTDFICHFPMVLFFHFLQKRSQWINAHNINYARRTKQIIQPTPWFGLDSANVGCLCRKVKGLLMNWTVYWWSEGPDDEVNGLLMKWRTCWWSERSVDEVTGLLIKWTVDSWSDGSAVKVKGLLIKWRVCWWSERYVDEVKGLLLKWKLTQSTWLRACACARRTVRIAVQCYSWIVSDYWYRVSRAWFSAGGLLVFSLNVSRLSWVDVYDSPPFGLCLQLTANVDSITRNA